MNNNSIKNSVSNKSSIHPSNEAKNPKSEDDNKKKKKYLTLYRKLFLLIQPHREKQIKNKVNISKKLMYRKALKKSFENMVIKALAIFHRCVQLNN